MEDFMPDCDYDTQDKFITVKFHYRGNAENTHTSDNNVQSYIDLLIYFELYVEVHIFPVLRFDLPCGNTSVPKLKNDWEMSYAPFIHYLI